MLDLVIKNGLFFDGLASRPVRSDIGILDGKVAVIAPQISRPSKETVDATGLWITPGFVDIHTHYDIER